MNLSAVEYDLGLSTLILANDLAQTIIGIGLIDWYA